MRSQTLHFNNLNRANWFARTRNKMNSTGIRAVSRGANHKARTRQKSPKIQEIVFTYVRPELGLSTILPKPKVAHSIYSCANFSNYENKFERHYEWVHEISTDRSRPLRFSQTINSKFLFNFWRFEINSQFDFIAPSFARSAWWNQCLWRNPTNPPLLPRFCVRQGNGLGSILNGIRMLEKRIPRNPRFKHCKLKGHQMVYN